MKIVVIGGSGLIGTKLVSRLRQKGHEVLPASPNSGVNTITGEGLAEALAGAQVVVDLANSPSFEDKAALEFFVTSGRNLLAAEATAGVGHHLALSVVGADRLPASGYLRAKMAQENLIKASGIPYTIVRSTQFFEFVGPIVESGVDGDVIRLSPALLQPIASDDVADAMADATLGAPVNGMIEIAGPEPLPLDQLARALQQVRGGVCIVPRPRAPPGCRQPLCSPLPDLPYVIVANKIDRIWHAVLTCLLLRDAAWLQIRLLRPYRPAAEYDPFRPTAQYLTATKAFHATFDKHVRLRCDGPDVDTPALRNAPNPRTSGPLRRPSLMQVLVADQTFHRVMHQR